MTRMPALKPKEVVSILEKAGYYIDHTTGSHYIMRHILITLSAYQFLITLKTSKRGVLHSIIKQSGLSKEEFLSLRP